MKNPLNAGICLEPSLFAQRSSLRNSSPKCLDRAGPSEMFSSLMADIIEKGNKTALPDNTLQLDNESLQRLINAVILQMNEYLVNELSDFDDGGQDAGVFKLQPAWTYDYGTGNDAASIASSSKQEPQKTKKIISPFRRKTAFPAPLPAHRVYRPEGRQAEFDEVIEHASNTYGVDPELITSVIKAESDFDAGATSSKGAMGLMQLMPETARELGVKNCYNPVENIMAGTRYLKSLLNRYDGNVALTLAAYNWGMGNVEKHPERLPQETRAYIARVSRFLQKGTI
jgi:Transglycosylase SLT domain